MKKKLLLILSLLFLIIGCSSEQDKKINQSYKILMQKIESANKNHKILPLKSELEKMDFFSIDLYKNFTPNKIKEKKELVGPIFKAYLNSSTEYDYSTEIVFFSTFFVKQDIVVFKTTMNKNTPKDVLERNIKAILQLTSGSTQMLVSTQITNNTKLELEEKILELLDQNWGFLDPPAKQTLNKNLSAIIRRNNGIIKTNAENFLKKHNLIASEDKNPSKDKIKISADKLNEIIKNATKNNKPLPSLNELSKEDAFSLNIYKQLDLSTLAEVEPYTISIFEEYYKQISNYKDEIIFLSNFALNRSDLLITAFLKGHKEIEKLPTNVEGIIANKFITLVNELYINPFTIEQKSKLLTCSINFYKENKKYLDKEYKQSMVSVIEKSLNYDIGPKMNKIVSNFIAEEKK